MIDLHLHTTVSDGLLTPGALIARASAAGITTCSITDHDTVAGLHEGRTAAARVGLRLIAGIEMTAVEGERDVHVLGYFLDPESAALGRFLQDQRRARITRVREIGARLRALGYDIDVAPLAARATESGRAIGRPAIADALVAAGHAADRTDAFDRLLARGRPAFVPRRGVGAADVIAIIHGAGGIASLAHPGLLDDDQLIPRLVPAGLDALEVWHSDHSDQQRVHYAAMSARFDLARSGGSDYHGENVHRACRIGGVALPPEELARLESLAGAR